VLALPTDVVEVVVVLRQRRLRLDERRQRLLVDRLELRLEEADRAGQLRGERLCLCGHRLVRLVARVLVRPQSGVLCDPADVACHRLVRLQKLPERGRALVDPTLVHAQVVDPFFCRRQRLLPRLVVREQRLDAPLVLLVDLRTLGDATHTTRRGRGAAVVNLRVTDGGSGSDSAHQDVRSCLFGPS